jgi:hypothetical protein
MDEQNQLAFIAAGFDNISHRLDLIEIRLQTIIYQTNTALSHIRGTDYKDESENTHIEIQRSIRRKYANQSRILEEMLKTLEIQKSLFDYPVDDPEVHP